jgi:hypothetical protein
MVYLTKNAYMKNGKSKDKVNNIIVVSDTHCGCQLGLMPPTVKLDSGLIVQQSPLQKKMWAMWNNFWEDWVPKVTKGEPYIIVHNGDVIDGVHHDSVTQITHNITDQIQIAIDVMRPRIEKEKCVGYYHIRGTEAHVGKSAMSEEGVAKALGAIPDSIGNHARWDMWMRTHTDHLIHFTHHVGTSASAPYESTAVYKELVESFVESGRFNKEPPDCVVRSHRHRQFEIRIATEKGYGISLVTSAWQLRTPFTFRVGLGRSSSPQIGGYLIRVGDEDGIYTRFKVWDIEESKTRRRYNEEQV